MFTVEKPEITNKVTTVASKMRANTFSSINAGVRSLEKNAIINSIIHGEKDFLAMAVYTDSHLVKSPCGSCRQFIFEFSKDLQIYFYGPDYFNEFNIKELFPEGFSL